MSFSRVSDLEKRKGFEKFRLDIWMEEGERSVVEKKWWNLELK